MKTVKSLLFSAVMAVLLPVVCAWGMAPVEEASSDYQSTTGLTKAERVKAPVDEMNGTDTEVDNHADFDGDQSGLVNTAGGVEEPSTETSDTLDTSDIPVDARVKRLEQQANNMANMNLPQQFAELQQQVAQLRGQLEVQRHDLQLLSNQLAALTKAGSVGALDNAKHVAEPAKALSSVQLEDEPAYQAAFNLLAERKYDQSQSAFAAYINKYPQGKYIADAHYWLGEMYLLSRNPKKAEAEFQTVISKYPSMPKVADARLKIAIIHANAGNIKQAKAELIEIKQKNPNSTAAQLANIRLQQLEQGDSATQ